MSFAADNLLVNQIVALWTADATFNSTYPPGRRIQQNRDGAARELIFSSAGVGDFSQIRLYARNADAGLNAPRTFAQNATSFTSATCDMTIPHTQVIVIKTIHENQDLSDQTAKEQVWRRLLWAKYPKLGLAWVSGWTERTTREKRNDAETGFVERTVRTDTQTFALRPLLSQLAS